eukprot:TRINITY_DN43177_c0_g1_i1.p1 TRINITY_DN43177_c0_g1~~TRINITY_DN43177_c0_g1_i1.p1  ORF type:complete len:512 (+),score=90.78 TRINITY_DN43177_c0_g1_i1:103-1536(+)
MPRISSMRQYSSLQQEQQQSYMHMQNTRVTTEWSRTNNSERPGPGFPGEVAQVAGGFQGEESMMASVPEASKCIGQVVLDWEFLHDLDLHLLKVQQTGSVDGHASEPSPEPSPHPAADLSALVEIDARGQRLRNDVNLQSIVSYRSKTYNPAGASTPEAVLQVDRNAAVHSIKPVENLYLTETLEPGAYVVAVHNYTLRRLNEDVIGTSASHQYRTFEDFRKGNPGYQKMEKALEEQNAHAGDPDGTPEKQAIMARVDREMSAGFQSLQSICSTGRESDGVHYGITVYTYPEHWSADAKHPQMASLDELQNLFESGFFATADFVFDPTANSSGYNGGDVLANVFDEQSLALGHQKAAYVALLKVEKEPSTGKSKISELMMLEGRPDADIDRQGTSQQSSMNQFRMQQMRQRSSRREPFPEPVSQQTPTQAPGPVQQLPTERRVREPPLRRIWNAVLAGALKLYRSLLSMMNLSPRAR